MSVFRRRLMTISEKYILGIDFSKQPDNELWYITTDGEKTDNSDRNLMGEFGKQEGLSVISHTYINGLGKVRYSDTLKVLGGQAFRSTRNTLLVSLPRTLEKFGAFCFGDREDYGVDYLVLLRGTKVVYNYQPQFKPNIKKATFVMPGCVNFYKDNLTNVIEKKLRDIEYITFENPNVEHTCLVRFDTNKDGKISIDEAESVTSINRFFNNTDIENLNDFQHFKNVTNISNAFFGCSKIKVANIWEGVQELGENLLMGANNIEKVIFPSTIRNLGQMWIRSRLIGKAVVIIKSETPPMIHNYNFTSVAKTLYVPDSAVDRYKADTKIVKYLTDNIKPISEYKDDK